MYRRIAQLLVALVATVGVLVTGTPEADAARSSSMAESRLITDTTDVYLFPQVGVEHARLLSLDYGFAPAEGAGLALFGDEQLAFGAGLYQGDVLVPDRFFFHPTGHGRLGNITNPIEPTGDAGDPHTIGDLFVSSDIGGGLIGARLTFGSGGVASVNADDEQQALNHHFAGVTVGYSLVDQVRIDTSFTGQFSLASETDESADEERLGEGNSFLVGASLRGFSPMADDMELGFLADLYFDRQSWTDDPDDEEIGGTAILSRFSALGGVGPAYNIDDETEIAAYGVLGYLRTDTDPSAHDDELYDASFSSRLVVPGVHVATDIQLFEWLFFRTGAQYNFAIDTDGSEIDPEDNDRDNVFTRDRVSGFGWQAGLGVKVDRFSLDGVFQHGFVAGGPDFLGDPAGSMFTMVSASYDF